MLSEELFTVGVEEEMLLVDPRSRRVTPDADRVVAAAQGGANVEPEFRLSQVETATAVCRSLGEVRKELGRLRRELRCAAARSGSEVAASGTHPFSHGDEAGIAPKERYLDQVAQYQLLAREFLVCGCHVHVGLNDPEAVVQVVNRVRQWLAPILALSVNSPFWLGVDTGYASFRTMVQRRTPLGGVPEVLDSRQDYDRLVDTLARIGIDDAGRIKWDVRPSPRYPTAEFRVSDVCLTVDEAVMVAGLVRGLATSAYHEWQGDAPVLRRRPELFRLASWRAARYGLEGELVDVVGERLLPAPEMVQRLLAHVRPALEEHGDWDEVASLVERTTAIGTGAARQRQVFRASGRMEDVVAFVVGETSRG